MSLVDRFMRLYQSNQRSYGVYNLDGKMHTVKEAPTKEHFNKHFNGTGGLGLVPILDDGNCLWGTIDIDVHGADESIDIFELEREVRAADLPLMVCRSKSGGAHLYLFCAEATPAKLVRVVLNKWATQLHHNGAEVFPKQDRLLGEGKDKQLGNWINLCYFNHEQTERYCVEGNKQINLDYFVEVAESRRVSAAMLVEKSEGDHAGAPPCIHRMISSGVASGMRNEALYNVCIYLKQAYPETWKDKAFDINARIFSVPLSHSEAKKTVTSVARRDYRYKCKEEPCKSLCNSGLCVQRKFGITKEESAEIFIGDHPEFDHLRKYLTEPPRWGLVMDGVEVTMSTPELMDYRRVQEAVVDKLTILIPPMKKDRWAVKLKALMEKAVIIDAPEEASGSGLIWQHLMQFLQRADLDSDGLDTADRALLLRGVPVVQDKGGNRVVYFRGSDFVNYLRKNRAEEMRGPNLWFALKNHGVYHGSLRIGNTTRQVWHLSLDQVLGQDFEDKTITVDY